MVEWRHQAPAAEGRPDAALVEARPQGPGGGRAAPRHCGQRGQCVAAHPAARLAYSATGQQRLVPYFPVERTLPFGAYMHKLKCCSIWSLRRTHYIFWLSMSQIQF